nr:MAG TPA: hypothetical protein [Bacteriophage sp.]
MLKTNKTRRLVAEFIVTHEDEEKFVKSATITFDNQGTSVYNDYISDKELYDMHRAEMREDEAKLNELRYEIENQIIAELGAKNNTEEATATT